MLKIKHIVFFRLDEMKSLLFLRFILKKSSSTLGKEWANTRLFFGLADAKRKSVVFLDGPKETSLILVQKCFLSFCFVVFALTRVNYRIFSLIKIAIFE
jgi:hypothetical protein